MFRERSTSVQAAQAGQDKPQHPVGALVSPPDRAAAARQDAPPAIARDGGALAEPPQVQMTHVNGIWRVTVNSLFYGDFSREPDAAAAVAAHPDGLAATRAARKVPGILKEE